MIAHPANLTPRLSDELTARLSQLEDTVYDLDNAELDLARTIKLGRWTDLPAWASSDLDQAVKDIGRAVEQMHTVARKLQAI